jgi:acyl-CoA-binding protein
MSFGAELKDFIAAAKTGKDLADFSQQGERAARTKYYEANTAAREQDTAFKADAYKRAQMPNTELLGEAGKTGAAVRGEAIPTAAAKPAVDKSQPRGLRNNNALNIEDGPYARKMVGYSGGDGRFARFEKPEHGQQAADNLLRIYGAKHGINTVAGVIGRWAPAAEKANNTEGYAAYVAKKIGVDPTAPINLADPAIRQKLIPAMSEFENGQQKHSALPLAGEPSAMFAESGGPVEERPPADDDRFLPQPVEPAIPDDEGPDGDQLPPNAQPTSGMSDIAGLFQAGHKAVKDGLMSLTQRFNMNKRSAVPDPNAGGSMRAYLSGEGSAPRSDMAQVMQAVDPEGKMSESERNLAALGAVYNFYAVRDPAKAQQAAGSMIQYMRTASARYASIAAAHAEAGDIDGTVNNMLRAYANIPNGQDVKFQKNPDGSYAYSFTDESGKVVNKGVASPQQIASMAMRMTPGEFDKWILTAAGQRAPQAEGPSKAYTASMGKLGPDKEAVPTSPQTAAAPDAEVAPNDVAGEEEEEGATEFSGASRVPGALPTDTGEVAPEGNPQGGPPVFDNNAYLEMSDKEQKAYVRAFSARHRAWKAEASEKRAAAKAQQPTAKSKSAGGGAIRASERGQFDQQLDSAWTAWLGGKGKSEKDIKPEYVPAIKNSAQDVMTHPQNGRMNASQAVEVVMALGAGSPGGEPDFSVVEKRPEGVMIELKNGRTAFVPKSSLPSLMKMRREQTNALIKQQDDQAASAKRSKENWDATKRMFTGRPNADPAASLAIEAP